MDWEAAHLGDPLGELSRASWGAERKDPRSFDVLVEGCGADPAMVRAWSPIHAAELWLWFAEAGPPGYLEQLTAELRSLPPRGNGTYGTGRVGSPTGSALEHLGEEPA
ncbi:hypothetical protein [Micromonospora sp. CPCC 205561]|uniref:hypothetical protein n=1 Tax=Micromonospora sp. CPCC 205561 TaxID=3122407 RepID=UPI002FF2592B